LNLNSAMHTLALSILLSFFSIHANRPRGFTSSSLAALAGNLDRDRPLVVSGWSRGEEEEPEATLPALSPLSLTFDHRHLCEPPTGVRHSARTLARPHTAVTSPPYSSCPCNRRHGHRGHPTGAEQHRPSLDPSARHQPRVDLDDQFPEPPRP
jgi:hypothetical protein